MNDNVHKFSRTADITLPVGQQPDPDVIKFCEDLLQRAKTGEIQAVAVATVNNEAVTADGWQRGPAAGVLAHLLMASITYLQVRYASQVNDNAERAPPPQETP